VLAQYVNQLEADRIAEGLGDRGQPLGLGALDVGVDDRLAGSPAGEGASTAPPSAAPAMTYAVRARIVSPGRSETLTKASRIDYDSSPGTGEELPGPAELLSHGPRRSSYLGAPRRDPDYSRTR